MTYSEFRHYNIILGCNASRISMCDDRGAEYYALVPMNGTGRENRAMRERALDAVELAILNGNEPGRVEVV